MQTAPMRITRASRAAAHVAVPGGAAAALRLVGTAGPRDCRTAAAAARSGVELAAVRFVGGAERRGRPVVVPALDVRTPLSARIRMAQPGRVAFTGVHHVALLCEDLDRSLAFYEGVLGLEINPDRPHSKLPYRGAWLWIGPEMIHLMQLPNPDPLQGRPEHGGRDRHFCTGVEDIEPLIGRLDEAGIEYTRSMSGRPAVFFRDPDMNVLEVVQTDAWR